MEEIKERLYQEIKRRYTNLDNLTKRMQNNVYESGTIEIGEQDINDLCAILDTFNGVDLTE